MIKSLLLIFIVLFFAACESSSISKDDTNKFTLEKFNSKFEKDVMLLEIGASSCQSCIQMKKRINELKSKEPSLPIYVMDVYDDPKIFSNFNIQLIPTQIAYDKEGNEVYRHIGPLSKEELLNVVSLAKKGK